MKIKQVSKDIWMHMKDSDLPWVAGSLAYSTVLSMVPFFALTLSIFQLFGGLDFLEPKVQQILLQYFQQAVGGEASLMLKKILLRMQSKTFGITSIIFLFFTSFILLQNIQNGINRMWDKKIKRPLAMRILISWILLSSFILLLAVYTGFRSLDFVKPILQSQKELMDFLVLGACLLGLYKFLPESKVRWKSALTASFVAGLGLIVLQSSFSWITKTFFGLGKVYGSLAAIPLLLTWVLFLWYVVLIGAALAASLDKSSNVAAHKRES